MQNFEEMFKQITGNKPFPWQHSLYNDFLEKRFPTPGNIPTGLGKTSIMVIWLLALAHHAAAGTILNYPRRLVYVVNRRTVVDQATREAEQIREAIRCNPNLQDIFKLLCTLASTSNEIPLAISTLRGQFADNAEWREDPARAAIVIGTVDMIGSRLLFSGYGCGFKSRPLHAGFLAQDTLLVHDEAHLEPAFQQLVDSIKNEQIRANDFNCFHVIELTATSRTGDTGFNLTDADLLDDEINKRVKANKRLTFVPMSTTEKLSDKIVKHALEKYKESNQAVLIYVRKVDDALKIAEQLEKEKQNIQTLTGAMRGFERDALVKHPIFVRFIRNSELTHQTGTVFLICTSAGEVGVNISANHMICDRTAFDSMAQRLGRVNRFGEDDANVDVFFYAGNPDDVDINETEAQPPNLTINNEALNYAENKQNSLKANDSEKLKLKKAKDQSRYDIACEKTHALLKTLPANPDDSYDASPYALWNLDPSKRFGAFAPAPVILPATDILFDAWALTSIRQKLPGRPAVAEWLHGISDWEPPETCIAWREEVGLLDNELHAQYNPQDLLEDYPLKPHELLRDNTKRIYENLKKLNAIKRNFPVWLVSDDGHVQIQNISTLIDLGEDRLKYKTVLLPPIAGGLQQNGMFNGNVSSDASDVADEWRDDKERQKRRRIWDDEPGPPDMRLVRVIDMRLEPEEFDEDDETVSKRLWRWYVRPRDADDDGSKTALSEQRLEQHHALTLQYARSFASALKLNNTEAAALVFAAKWHDRGKARKIWQYAIGNYNYPGKVLAKSSNKMSAHELSDYRHEFGSLIDIKKDSEFRKLSAEAQELALHLIAAHHGRARPHFDKDEAVDAESKDDAITDISRETPRRYARLQRKYGRWGLAYLESLLRAADIMASQTNDPNTDPVVCNTKYLTEVK